VPIVLTPEGWARVASLEYRVRFPRTRDHHLICLEAVLIPLFTRAMRLGDHLATPTTPSPEETTTMPTPVLNYWDIDPRARALMTREQVESHLDYELASRGVLKAVEPVLLPIQPVEIPTATYYKVQADGYVDLCVFKTAEQAHAFVALEPMGMDYSYEAGPRVRHAKVYNSLSVESVPLATQADYTNALSILRENKAASDANEKAQKTFEEDCRAMDNATSEVWSDWQDQQGLERQYQRVLATWKDYLKLTGGDTGIALNFMFKVFTAQAIHDAREWLGEDWDAPEPLEGEGHTSPSGGEA